MIRADALCVVGCGGHGRSVADVALTCGERRIVFIDEAARPNERIFGFPVLTLAEFQARGFALQRYIIALGDNAARENAFRQFGRLARVAPLTIVSPDARRGRDDRLGDGVFVGSGAHLGPDVTIGDDTIVNTRAIVEHETHVGAHGHIAVNALLAGRVHVGSRAFIGAGAVVADGVHICDDVTVGAGAVVVSDIIASGTYIGVPARLIGEERR